jgi:hypothetical protein
MLKRFENAFKLVANMRLRCPVGMIMSEACSDICKKRLVEKRFFNFDQHRSLRGNHCFRCGDTSHGVAKCPTRWNNKHLRPKAFRDGVCGICGLYLTKGHGSRLGEVTPLFHHDAMMEQTLDSSWRQPGRCKSGLGDHFYPLLYLAYKQSNGTLYLSLSAIILFQLVIRIFFAM